MACKQESVYYDNEIGQWVAVDSYCVVRGEEIEVKNMLAEKRGHCIYRTIYRAGKEGDVS